MQQANDAPPTCGEALIQLLERYGVDTVFGIPGAHTLELYRGLAHSGIRHVQARHEQGAGFMADGYARISGRPGVCVLISGPGVTNAATPMGQAYADSIPMLVISSCTPSASLGKGWGCLHEITDQRAVTAPLTSLSATALAPSDLPELLGQAFAGFAAARPRPAHITVPTDVLAQPAPGAWAPRTLPARPQPDQGAVQAAAALLALAQRPLLIVGGGAGGDLAALAERLGAAVVTSNAGKGLVPSAHPLCVGASSWRRPTQRYIAQADVVLAIGTELSETDSYIDRLPLDGQLIRIDIDIRKLNDRYPCAVGICADAAATVAALLAALPAAPADRVAAVCAEVAAVRAEVAGKLSPTERQHLRVLEVLRAALPADALIIGDMTQLVYTATFALPTELPHRWHYAAGYCTLGCALPMAIGARLAAPTTPVVALAGDAGFLFTLQELATAAELGLSLPIILWNNTGLGQIRAGMDARGIPHVGVTPHNPDFLKLAEAFGCRSARPASAADLADAIAAALAAPVPTLIEVREGDAWLI